MLLSCSRLAAASLLRLPGLSPPILALAAIFAFALAAAGPAAAGDGGGDAPPQLAKRWVKIDLNATIEADVERALQIVRRAHRAGFNGVVLSDTKTDCYHSLGDRKRWLAGFRKPMALAEELGMETIVGVLSFGYGTGLLINDVHLATGHPVVAAPLLAEGPRLVPQQTARVRNGSFEDHDPARHSFAAFTTDAPGAGSFVDRQTFKDGAASIRLEDIGSADPEHGNGRVRQTVAVRPFQQYRLRVWVRAENLTARQLAIYISNSRSEQRIQWQFIETPNPDGGYDRIETAENWTTDGWVEQHIVFNSLDADEVEVLLGMWGGGAGKLWWDGLRIEPAPALNLLRRDDLPIAIESAEGRVFIEGEDFLPVVDRRLGDDEFRGDYGWRQRDPPLVLAPGTAIEPGSTVYFSGFHALPVFGDQVGVSLCAPGSRRLIDTVIGNVAADLRPSAYFLWHNELRSGGWEPASASKFATTGDALAEHMRWVHEAVRVKGGGRPVYVWSDMFDPHANAVAGFFAANNTFEGSWKGLSPDTVVVNWNMDDPARSLAFFDALGHRQIVAAYYDEDVGENADRWIAAVRAAELSRPVEGVLYASWSDRYDDLEAFARRWWAGPDFAAERD